MSHIQKYKDLLNQRDYVTYTPESYVRDCLYDSDYRLIGTEGVTALYGDLCVVYLELIRRQIATEEEKREFFEQYKKTLTYSGACFHIAGRGLRIAIMDDINRFFRRWNPWR